MAGIIPQATLEEIRTANDIAGVIGSYFQLQQRGATLKALCPFHKEKTPSFIVNQQRQIFHCFGCGAGGDVFKFIMDYEKVDFMTAVRMLARRAGIRLRFDEDKQKGGPKKDALFELLAQAAAFYHALLKKDRAAAAARKYLRARGFTSAIVSEFMIGYAPDAWDAILKWAAGKHSVAELEAAGLILAADSDKPSKGKRHYDRFRDRVMFPIHDEQGRVAGFSARALSEQDSGAKYINTPETAVFQKSRILYGLNKARRAIAEAHEAILCEGQIDVISCHAAGFNTAVAAQGTAFTEEHARILRRYADTALLVFDADTAGQNAALKASESLTRAGMEVRVASLPAGEDPDAILHSDGGKKRFKKLLDAAAPALDFLIELFIEREGIDSEAKLMRVVSAALNLVEQTPNAVQRDLLIRRAANKLGQSEFSLQKEFQKKLAKKREPRARDEQPSGKPGYPPKEEALTEHLLSDPSSADLVKRYLPLELLTDKLCRIAVQAALEAAESGRDVMEIISEQDGKDRELSRFAAAVIAAPQKATGGFATDEDCVKSLILGIRSDAIKKRRKEIELAQAGTRGSKQEQIKDMEMEYCQLGYDLALLKNWETAVPMMENS